MSTSEWAPLPSDVAWANGVLNVMGDSGVLAYPVTRLIYLVQKQTKSIMLLTPMETLSNPNAFDTHERVKEVFGLLGYRVLGE